LAPISNDDEDDDDEEEEDDAGAARMADILWLLIHVDGI
jgi:hypothetical protein